MCIWAKPFVLTIYTEKVLKIPFCGLKEWKFPILFQHKKMTANYAKLINVDRVGSVDAGF